MKNFSTFLLKIKLLKCFYRAFPVQLAVNTDLAKMVTASPVRFAWPHSDPGSL